MEKIRDIVSFNLKRIRKERNKSQLEVAEKCGFQVPSYSRWENGKSWPNPTTIQTLSKFYGISPTDFYKPKDGIFKVSLTDALKVLEDETGIKVEVAIPLRKPKKTLT